MLLSCLKKLSNDYENSDSLKDKQTGYPEYHVLGILGPDNIPDEFSRFETDHPAGGDFGGFPRPGIPSHPGPFFTHVKLAEFFYGDGLPFRKGVLDERKDFLDGLIHYLFRRPGLINDLLRDFHFGHKGFPSSIGH